MHVQLELLEPTEAEPEGKGDYTLTRLSEVGFKGWVFHSRQ